MSKFNIVLCAVLFASAADAYELPNALETAQEPTNTTLKTLGKRFEGSRKHIDQVTIELRDHVGTCYKEIYNEVKRINNELVKLINGFESLHDNCSKSISPSFHSYATILSNAGKYIEVSQQPVSQQIQSIRAIFNDVGQKAPHCFENIDGVKSVDEAIILCDEADAKSAIKIFQEYIPKVDNITNELDLSMKTVKSHLANCTAEIYNQSLVAMEELKNCVQQTLNGEEA